MKMSEASKIMNKQISGYIVCFDWSEDGFLRGDHFPDIRSGESLIETEAEAWSLLIKFASALVGKAVNLYVADKNFKPIRKFDNNKLENRGTNHE